MTVSLTRRQVMRLALVGGVTIASCAAASGPFALTIFAGQVSPSVSSTVLLGVRAGAISAGGPAIGVPLLVQSVDVATGLIQTIAVPQQLQDGTPVFKVSESITGWAVLADGTLAIAITPAPGSGHESEPTRLTHLSQTAATTVPISGLKRNEQMGSIVPTLTGSLLGLVEKRNGTPPLRLVTLDPRTGVTTHSDVAPLAGLRRFTTLTQCQNGRLYSSVVGKDGETSLVELDTGVSVPLTEQGVVWNNGLASLVCSGSDRLVALSGPRYAPNALYDVDPRSGVMTRVRDFDMAKLAAVPINFSSS